MNTYRLLGSFVDRPLIVAGAGRSGTTALLNALGEHPEVLTMRGERPYVTDLGGMVHDLEHGPNSSWRIGSLHFEKEYMYETYRKLCFESAFGRGGKLALKELAKKKTLPSAIKYWSVKAFPTEGQFEGFIELYPEARIIGILRNGIDNVNSRMRHPTFRHDSFEEHCREWVHLVGKYDYLNSKTEHAAFVRQEELRDQPHEVFDTIQSALGLSDSNRPLEYVQSTVVHPLDKKTQSHTDAKKVLSQRAPAHESWTDEQRRLFKEICGETMAEVGYAMPY